MQRHTHQIGGLAVFLLVNHQHPGLSLAIQGACLLAAYMGATTPDDLECPIYRNGLRRSIIPHRTLTHWLLPWSFATGYLVVAPGALRIALLSYCAAALLHVLMDACTRKSVPVLFPWN